MVIGITMLKVVPGQEKTCYGILRHVVGIKEIYHLFGEFDFFLILSAVDKKELYHLLNEIRGRKYVLDSWSLLVSDYESHSTPVRSCLAARNPFHQETTDALDTQTADVLLTTVIASNPSASKASSA